MRAENKRFLVVTIILALSAGLIFFIESSQKKLRIVEESVEFPIRLGDWSGEEIPVSQRTLDILETPFVIIRKFTNPKGEVVYFSGVFSSRNRKAIHPPEVCLTGGGVAAHKDIVNLKIGGKSYPTNQLLILPGEANQPKELIFYWYRLGEKLFTNFYAQQLQMAWYQILRKPLKSTDIALLRISTPQRSGEEKKEIEERLKEFAKVLFAYLKL